jgi:Holliday junction resolvasome RuvABC endonuclease subunit
MNLMGVDLGIHKVAMFGWDGDIPYAHAWSAREDANRSLQLLSLGSMVRDMAEFHAADVVWVEDTLVGNNVKYSIQLTEVRGAVMACVISQAEVHTVNVQAWKKHIVGDGHANKDSVRDYIHVTHGAYAPLCGADQDLYDACCIALYGRQVVERAKQLVDSGLLAVDDEPGGS